MHRSLLAATVLMLLAAATPSALGQKIYWADQDSIRRADLDGHLRE